MELLKDFDNADTISIDTLALEEMLLEERTREISELNSLSKKVCYLHPSLLYYRNTKSKMGAVCYEAWRTLVKIVGGSQNTWRDLGYLLDIPQDDLNYIMNSAKDDPVDLVIKLFMQNENATLDKVLDAFIKMQRYDILKAIEDPFSDLAQCFNRDDSGYHSNSNSGTKEIISYMKNLNYELPPALSKKFKQKDPNKPNQPTIRPSTNKGDKELNKDGPILFLTYTEDGLQTALNVKDNVESWTDMEVTVITLDERREEVYQNPEKFIREYFEKSLYMVPIVTSGYLSEIKSNNTSVPNTTDNLDHKYVNFIYKLMFNHYVHATGCLNKKVRSVLPRDINVDVLRNITMYPDLMPWTFETNFTEQFKAFVKKNYS